MCIIYVVYVSNQEVNTMSDYHNDYYHKNKEKCKIRQKRYLEKESTKIKRAENQRKYRKENGKNNYKRSRKKRREYLHTKYKEYMFDKTCQHCGYSDQRALVWHHLDPKMKKSGVIALIYKCHSWETILNEINKCICLCHNCHNILHNHESKSE